jgi:hypothetical protein
LEQVLHFSLGLAMSCTYRKMCEEAIFSTEKVLEMFLEEWQTEGGFIPEPSMLQLS